ncbi:MAG TPA: efflux RND transporter periplasmic adaptor subunit [Gallionella sp.]
MKINLRSRLTLSLIAAAVTGAIALAYLQFGASSNAQQYRVQAAERGQISQTVSANGTINPVSVVSVGTQVSGRVKKLYADHNSKVRRGQILLELDASLLDAQLKQSRANTQSAAAALDLATANEARMRDLYAQEYVSRQELDVAVQAKKSAQAQLHSAQAQTERDQANVGYAVVRSPVSGVVIDRQVEVGQTVASSFQTPTLFKIAQDLANMQIDASFAEADIGNIRVGQTARFTVDAFPDRSFKGEVKLIRLNPSIQQNVVTYNVVIDVDNAELILLPGMTAYVSITVAERRDALLVPNAALRFRPAERASAAGDQKPGMDVPKPRRDAYSGKVYVLENGRPALRNVTLGITDNRNTEITGGELKAGEQVITGDAQTANTASPGSSPMRMRMF